MTAPDRDTLGSLPTESRNPASNHLDELSTLEMLALINALNGVRFKLPIIGVLAESQAGR